MFYYVFVYIGQLKIIQLMLLVTFTIKSQSLNSFLTDILQGYDAIERGNDTLSAQLDALADLKFTHVISCQMFGAQKSSGHPQAQDILDLMIR